ncbi:MAG TPA: lysophospholipid acyltransferase family protein [Anaerolineae bacterium]|nr:lysophospholipid acyltransferase family protein [Anaerolineae bacterium]HQI86180.1 lysophospholipid acyltransferase family protein [Anaerolineae bacterium]
MLFEGYARPYFRPIAWPRLEPQPINWEDVLYAVGQPLVALYYKLTVNPDIVFQQPLPAGPKIIAANHPSTTDPLILTTLCAEPVRILITESVFTIPVVGRLLRRAGQIPVVRDNGRAAFDEALRRLRDGQTVGIFPEGSLSPREGGLHDPRTGAARLALLTGAPIIPVGIHLDRERLRYGAKQLDERDEPLRWYWRGPYAMTVGQPLRLAGDIEDRDGVHAAAEEIMQAIRQLAGQSEKRLLSHARAPITNERRMNEWAQG